MEEKPYAEPAILMAAAACSTKAMSLFKRTFALSPAAVPRGAGLGTPPRGCPYPPSAWPSKDWLRGEGSCGLLRSPTTAGRLPLPHSCSSTSPSSVCLLCPQDSLSNSLKTCYTYLNQTSRSFAAVIQGLDGEMRHAVCIFYLVLRALDTLEDDMTISVEKKVPMLHNFHSYLYEPDWRFMESKQKDRQVLEDFPTISLEFRNLAEKYQTVIVDICRKMGFGMAEFLNKHVTSEREWDKVWSRYVKKLSDFAKPENIDLAVHCLNELITNALHHIPDVITYLSRLRNQSVFNFCAVPQVMAIATLAACYNNQQVFKGVVKIRKGQAVTLMMDATNMPAVKAIIYQYMEEIYHRIPKSDPSSNKTRQIISTIRTQNLPTCQLISRSHYSPIYLSFVMLLAALSWQYLSTLSQVTEDYVQTGEH
ncbi:squalene synthase isoform 2-T2 [Trichechus inunguis]|uniref:Squalene synthase n=1 Tax=Trichechus manatus latirostris TaxID=127582 RepID=A0A2Y9RKP4_TRIMA|nr:squalene synthase isoform X2 [Trichechus manatus latirostris]